MPRLIPMPIQKSRMRHIGFAFDLAPAPLFLRKRHR
jgi:hypothetical protein